MKRSLVLWSTFCLTLLIVSCDRISVSSRLATVGDWRYRAELDGPARSSAFSFVINNAAYIGGGANSSDQNLNDLWIYEPLKNAWTQMANLPGPARRGAVAFSVGNIGYVGTGLDENGNWLKDFWQYDPTTDRWTSRQQFDNLAGKQSYGVAFVIDRKGYFVAGSPDNRQVWQYDAGADSWTSTRIGAFEGNGRTNAVGFAVGQKGYLTTGAANGTVYNDLWEFDPSVIQDE